MLVSWSAPVLAQDSTLTPVRRPWLLRSDLPTLGLVALGAASVAPFDARWTRGLQQPRFQDNRPLSRAADVVRTLGDPGALLISGSVFAIGAVSGHPSLRDAGQHATQAVLASGLVTLGLKALVGRARPMQAPAEAESDEFRLGRGFRSDYASFPSGHTTVAFAAAAAFSSEIARLRPSASRVATPLLYSAAAAVGVSRLYNDKHWASDAVVGAMIGTFVARRLVQRAHGAWREREQ